MARPRQTHADAWEHVGLQIKMAAGSTGTEEKGWRPKEAVAQSQRVAGKGPNAVCSVWGLRLGYLPIVSDFGNRLQEIE